MPKTPAQRAGNPRIACNVCPTCTTPPHEIPGEKVSENPAPDRRLKITAGQALVVILNAAALVLLFVAGRLALDAAEGLESYLRLLMELSRAYPTN